MLFGAVFYGQPIQSWDLFPISTQKIDGRDTIWAIRYRSRRPCVVYRKSQFRRAIAPPSRIARRNGEQEIRPGIRPSGFFLSIRPDILYGAIIQALDIPAYSATASSIWPSFSAPSSTRDRAPRSSRERGRRATNSRRASYYLSTWRNMRMRRPYREIPRGYWRRRSYGERRAPRGIRCVEPRSRRGFSYSIPNCKGIFRDHTFII